MADRFRILVEGRDGEYVLSRLLNHHNISEQIDIKNKNGIDNLLETLKQEFKASDLERLGIIVDADADIAARWQSLRGRLIQSGYNAVPITPAPDGTLIQQEDKHMVGVWLMPNNTLPGMLEDFVSFLGATSDPLWIIAENCLNEISEGHRRFIPNHRIKAHIHTWLAWQKDPGTPLGLAITKRYLDADALHAQQLMDWVRRLFDL